jgi:hypothetical protein
MVIARFHRTFAIGFFLLLVAVVTTVVGGFFYLVFHDANGQLLMEALPIIGGLACVGFSIAMVRFVFRDPRAVWIENGVLHFYGSFLDDTFFFLASKDKVPLDSIAGLSSFKEEFPGAVKRPGIYVDLKSGQSHKVLTFLLTEPHRVVMARLREALGFTEAKVDVS